MKRMKKFAAALLGLTLLSAGAMAEGPVLRADLPESAQRIESVAFENGDFIETYQLEGGATVQMLRYAEFDMTLDELIEGEWTGYTGKETLELSDVDGCPAQGVHLTADEEGRKLDVYVVLIDAQGQTLIFQTVFADQSEDDARQVQEWLDSMRVMEEELAENG